MARWRSRGKSDRKQFSYSAKGSRKINLVPSFMRGGIRL